MSRAADDRNAVALKAQRRRFKVLIVTPGAIARFGAGERSHILGDKTNADPAEEASDELRSPGNGSFPPPPGSAIMTSGSGGCAGTTRTFYDDLAATYDLIYRDWDESIRCQGRQLDGLLTALGVAALDPVLDCACGIGTQTLGLASLGRDVIGSDSSVVSVARARAEADDRGVRARLAAADMRALPFRDKQFAAVVCADNALPHLLTAEDLAAGLGEISRVLRSGGILLASTRDYDAARLDRPSFTPPAMRRTSVARAVTFQLWRWRDDGERYDFDHFQLTEVAPDRWQVARRSAASWALTRRQLGDALFDAGFESVTWYEPAESGFFQPLFAAKRR